MGRGSPRRDQDTAKVLSAQPGRKEGGSPDPARLGSKGSAPDALETDPMWRAARLPAVLSRPGGRGVRQRCPREGTRDSGTPAWRGHINGRGAQRHLVGVSGSDPCSMPGRPRSGGAQRAPRPLPPPAQMRLIQHGQGHREETGGEELYCTLFGGGAVSWGRTVTWGQSGEGCGCWSTTQASGSGAWLVPTSCHRRNSGRGMGVAPRVLCSAPGQCWLGLV